MKTSPLYTNLDTSFVNLSALLRYLRNQNFSGLVNVRLNGYQAKITFETGNSVNVEEHDQIAGRIAEGDEALQRLLIRAREIGGTINVLETVEDDEKIEPEISLPENFSSESSLASLVIPAPKNGNGQISSSKISVNSPPNDFLNLKPDNQTPLPFEFSNKVENRAKQKLISDEDWRTLLQLVGELFGAIEEIFNSRQLDFAAQIKTAQSEISGDYPFLNPVSGAFFYADGKAEMSAQVNAKLFAASINEILRRVLEKLAAEPDFSEVYRETTQKILALIYKNEASYDKFFITPRLKRIVGV